LWDPAPFIPSVTGYPMLTRKMNEKKKAPPELVHDDVAFAVKLGRIQGPKPGRAMLVSKQVAQVGPMRRIQTYKAVKRCRRWEHVGGGERALRYRQVRLHPTRDNKLVSKLREHRVGKQATSNKQQAASSKHGYRSLTYVLR
jgi:hypothetical protein